MTSTEELRRWLIERIAEACELDECEIDPTRPLDEYGLSSRDAVELAGALEERLGQTLPTTLLWDHPTVDRLAAALTGETVTEVRVEPVQAAEPIAVVGVGCRLPGGVRGAEEFWRLLIEGRDVITEVPEERWEDYAGIPESITRWGGFLEDVAGFDAEFFGIAPREAARMDPQQRMILEVAWEALEHAGIAPDSLLGGQTGVFVGISGTEYGARSLTDLSTVDPWMSTGAALSIAANRLSYVLDLRGPSLTVDTACSSSLTAVHLAVQSLRSGESDLALVGGANLLLGPGVTASFDEMGISSGDGRCKPFSIDADGIARAEGAGMVVLKRLSEARAAGDRVLAVIRGSATNSDGRSNGLTAPNAEAQQALLRTAYRQAGVDPAGVDYVEAHGTGTLLGDPIEARALGAVLGEGRDRPLLLGSVKSNLGHLEAAAGVVGLIKTVLALHHNKIPPSVNYLAPNPHIPFDELRLSVVDVVRRWPGAPALAGVSGFGFGGTNAHVVLQQAVEERGEASPEDRYRFLLGAPSDERLTETAGQLADWLADGSAPLADVAHTLARRLSGRRRAAVVASNRDELVSGLRALNPISVTPSSRGPVFVFSGHGSQWAGMGRRLLAEEPVFAEAIDRLDPLIKTEAGFSLRDDLLAGVNATTMDRVQPLVFGLQLALAELWEHYGVRPSAVIGHSFGEVAAAVVAGALSEADGARVVALRSRLLASLAGNGAMALLEVGAEEATELVKDLSDVDIAVLSGPNQTVVAGDAQQVRYIVSVVDFQGKLAKLVKLDVAAHSPIVDRVTGTLRDELTGISPQGANLTFYSTALTDPRQLPAFDPGYWARNLRQPVRFAAAVDAAAADGYRTFVELSPHPVLRHALADDLGTGALVVSSMRNCADETEHFHTQLATLELAGEATPARRGRIIDLPTTPWRHTRHWLPDTAKPRVAPLTGKLLETVWRPAPIAPSGTAASILVVSEQPSALAPALGARNLSTWCRALEEPVDAVVFALPEWGNLADAERAVLAVADITRLLVEAGTACPPRLLLVTTGSFPVSPGEVADPAFATLRGLVRVLACEHPEFRPGIVDLDPLWTAEEAAVALRKELASGIDDEVAWRSGVRYARRLEWLPEAAPSDAPLVRPDGGYVITGGLGGLGLFLAGWLAEQGAGRIILNGRSAPKPAAQRMIAESGNRIEVVLGDIAEPGVAQRLVEAAGNVRGVIHAAAVLDDRTTTRLDAETLHRSWLPKAYGAWRLHEATRDRELDWWVGFSSAAALHGSPGQPAYAAGNAYLDALVAMRRAQGLPGTSIAWGTWAEIGAAADLDIPWMRPIRPAEGLAVLTATLGRDLAHVGALRLNTPQLVSAFPQLTKIPFFESLLGDYAQSTDRQDDWAGTARLRELPPASARTAASTQLRARVASVLGFAPGRLDVSSPLSELGVDSLLAVRIRNAVQHDFELSLPVSLLLRGASVVEAEEWLFSELGIGGEPVLPSPAAVGPRDGAERLVASAWRDVLGMEVGVTQDFYVVGGDRPRAERVTALLAERSGRELTISELFEHPTIERMAAHLREEQRGGSPLRVLRADGPKTPLFFFHPGGGETTVYAQLAHLLDPAVPVYGFDRLEGVSAVEDRVRRYLPELRAVQPHGPYRLSGWSFGGFLAFEMAQQLGRAGEQVEVLALIDSIIPLPNDTGMSDVELTEKRFERFGEFLQSSYGCEIRLPYERLARLDDEGQVQLVVDTMRTEGLINGAVSDAILNHQRTSLLDTRSLERYTPQRYDGPVSFFSAADLPPGGLRDHRFDRTDPARGWDAVCTDLDVIAVPGHHLSLLDPPHVDEIGRRLNEILAGASLGLLR